MQPRTWILLRGLGREAAHWGELPQRLRDADTPALVLTPDLPGTGRAREQPCPARIEALAEVVRAQVRAQVGSQERFSLVGLSLGSMVALSWAQQFPHDVERMALLNGSVASLSPPWQRARPGALKLFAQVARMANGPERERRILEATASSAEARRKAWPAWSQVAAERPVSRKTLGRQLVAAARFRPRVRPLGVPTIVLAGLADALVNPECSRRLARALNAPLAAHEMAGHDLGLDAPEWVVETLTQWARGPQMSQSKSEFVAKL